MGKKKKTFADFFSLFKLIKTHRARCATKKPQSIITALTLTVTWNQHWNTSMNVK